MRLTDFSPVILCAALTLLGASVACAGKHDVPVPAPIAGQGYHLVENWDFGSSIKTPVQLHDQFFTRYVYNNGTLDTLNDEWEHYSDNNNHVLTGKTLELTARVVGGLKAGGIESGMLRSKWTGKYGYFECCMKVPKGRGMWPAFWLNPQDGKWPPEIDIMEIINNGKITTTTSYHNVHGNNTGNAVISTTLDKWNAYVPGFDYADGYHIFAVEWTPDEVRHYVDGKLIIDRHFYWTHNDGSDGGPAHVLVNLAVGGSWPGPPNSLDEFPAKLSIKYIRVWQKNTQPTDSPEPKS